LYLFLGEEVSHEKVELMPPLTLSQLPDEEKKGIFISCSHKDNQYLERLTTHLNGYLLFASDKSTQDILQIWDDTKMSPGKDWSEEIKEALAQAKVAILLVSKDFLLSKPIREQELPLVLDAAKKGDIQLVLVILDASSSAFNKDRDALYQYQAVNSVLEPLSKKKPYDQEVLWAKVAQKVFLGL
jgi:hypothetical protein